MPKDSPQTTTTSPSEPTAEAAATEIAAETVEEKRDIEKEIQELGSRIGRAMVELSRKEATVKRLKKYIENMVTSMDQLVEVEGQPEQEVEVDLDDDTDEDDRELGNPVGTALAAAESPAFDGKWEDASVAELQAHGVSTKLCERLIEAGADTIGRLEKLRAEIAMGREKWPRGIGEKKITDIENAVIEWLTKNRDSAVFASANCSDCSGDAQCTPLPSEVTVVVSDVVVDSSGVIEPTCGPIIPLPTEADKLVEAAEEQILADSAEKTAVDVAKTKKRGRPKKEKVDQADAAIAATNEADKPVDAKPAKPVKSSRAAEWDSLSDEQRESYLLSRISSIVTGPDIQYVEEFARIFQEGKDARRNSVPYAEVTWVPGVEQDAWLHGWAIADANSDDSLPDPVAEPHQSNVAGHGELVSVGSVVAPSPVPGDTGLVDIDDI